jgi:galactoside O-acetyltransferase
MIDNSWYSQEELKNIGFGSIGKNVFISKKVSIYGAENIFIGNNIRIDDYCIFACTKGKLFLNGYNHIAAFCYINSAGNVTMEMFSGISSRCSIYSATENYDGSYLTNPTVPSEYTHTNMKPIYIGKHAVIGTNCTILPGCNVEDYSSVGAFSLVTRSIPQAKIAKGIPAKVYRDRNITKLKQLENMLLKGN